MEKKPHPSDFNWVTARWQCSAWNMFELLKGEASANKETVEALWKARGHPVVLSFHDNDQFFAVSRWVGTKEHGVKFVLRGNQIHVESLGEQVNFTASLTLSDDGECRLVVDDVELDRWQVLRRALEPLFFRPD